jgi:IPT/TIG domain
MDEARALRGNGGARNGPRRMPDASARRLLALVAALAAISALMMAFVVGASARIVRMNGVPVSYEALPASTQRAAHLPAFRASLQTPLQKAVEGGPKTEITYHGGPVMQANTNYTIYWDPSGAPEYPSGYEAGINRYFEDLAHDSGGNQNTDSVLNQYGDSAGEFANYNSHFGGALSDTDPYPANGCSAAPICFTEEQLRAELARFVEAHGLPTNLEHEYFLLTPPGVESCFEAAGHACSAGTKHKNYCSYHGYIFVATGVLIFANDPYVAGLNCDYGEEHPNNNPSDATLAGGLVHEHSGSLTDPELSAWYDEKNEEIPDRCRNYKPSEYGEPLGKAPDGAYYNQVINGDLYLYQQEWSNQAGECLQRTGPTPLPPTVTRVKPKSGSASGNTLVTITGTNFSAPATVKFGEVAAPEVSVESAKTITAVSPAHAAGTVGIAVTTVGGTSASNKKAKFKYKKK